MSTQDPPGDDDPQAFHRAMQDVRPLARKAVAPARPRPRAIARFSRAERQQELPESRLQAGEPAALEEGERLLFRRTGVRDQALRRLKRGQFPVEAECDLHGMHLHPASDALRQFIADCVGRRLQCVRVIHGKGLRSGPGGPVLKVAVSHWLRQFDSVAAYASARPADGGSGALYVLLR
jgi:DNA-nicking Smr family endonuclease